MSDKIEKAREVIANIKRAEVALAFLPELCKNLEQLPNVLDALQEEANLQASWLSYRDTIGKRLAQVEEQLKQQADQLFLSDEEHKQMVNHVHTVLAQLEEYLRRHT